MPPDVELVDSQSSCELTLKEGIQSLTVKVKAACKQGGVKGGYQAIIPKVVKPHSPSWMEIMDGLPTIWVCIHTERL